MIVHSTFFLQQLFHSIQETLFNHRISENVQERQKPSHFKLLSLPRVALIQTLRSIDLIDLLDLSLCSRKMQIIIESINWQAPHCNILVGIRFSHILVFFEDGSTIKWRFTSDISTVKSKLRAGEEFIPRKIGGVILEMSAKNWDRRTIHSVTADFETNVRRVFDHLRHVFRCHIELLFIRSSVIESFFSHSESQKLKIKNLQISADDLQLTENLENILKNVEVEGFVHIQGKGWIWGGAEEFFRLDSVYVKQAEWVTRGHFLRADCKQMILYNADLTQEDLNEAFHRWLRGEGRLEKLLVYRREICQGSVESILRELPTRPWDPRRRHGWLKFNECTAVDCRQGYDIERSDGTLATIAFDENTVVFSVWKKLFPDFTVPVNASWRLSFSTFFAFRVERRPWICGSEEDARANVDFSSDQ